MIGRSFKFFADNVQAYLEEEKMLRHAGEYEQAEIITRKGLQEYPDNAALYHALAKRLRSKWQDEEALRCFEKAHELDPNNGFIAADYGMFLYKQGEVDQSELVLLKAFDDEHEGYSRSNLHILTSLGHVYQERGLYEYSALCFGRAHEMDPYDDRSERRLYEVIRNHNVHYSNEGWEEFLTGYAQEIINESAADAVQDGPKPAP